MNNNALLVWLPPHTNAPDVCTHGPGVQPELGQSLSALSPALRQYFSRKYFIIHIILSCSFLICFFQRPPVRQSVHQHHHRALRQAGPLLQRVRDEEHHPTLRQHGQPPAAPAREPSQAPASGQGEGSEYSDDDSDDDDDDDNDYNDDDYKEALQRTEGGDSPKNVDDWLARRISDILTDTYYKFSGI